MITLATEDAKALFDMVLGSMDFGSGFLDNKEVDILRAFAVKIGLDPMEATPSNFRKSYAHEFRAMTPAGQFWSADANAAPRGQPALLLVQRPAVDPSDGWRAVICSTPGCDAPASPAVTAGSIRCATPAPATRSRTPSGRPGTATRGRASSAPPSSAAPTACSAPMCPFVSALIRMPERHLPVSAPGESPARRPTGKPPGQPTEGAEAMKPSTGDGWSCLRVRGRGAACTPDAGAGAGPAPTGWPLGVAELRAEGHDIETDAPTARGARRFARYVTARAARRLRERHLEGVLREMRPRGK